MDGERADRKRGRLISRRQRSQMDRGERGSEVNVSFIRMTLLPLPCLFICMMTSLKIRKLLCKYREQNDENG